MFDIQKPISPAVGDVGILAVSDDRWNGIWTTRHYMLHHLARFFHVAWLEPMEQMQHILTRPPKVFSARANTPTVKSVTTAGVKGVRKCQPFRWIPEIHRPPFLRNTIRSLRYAKAASFLRNLGCRRLVLYLWRPWYVDALESRRWFDTVIYHMDDEYSFAEEASPITVDELTMIREANAVIVHSPGLAARKRGINENMHIVPNGVEYQQYSRRWDPPQDLHAIPRPRIGYVGVIKKHLDMSLMRRLVERCPTWSFVFVGPRGNISGQEAEFEAMSKAPNVHLMGYRNVADLPAYQQHFDVCIMPYKMTAYTDSIYPLKLHDYLASGKPVVASPIRTLKDFSHVVSLASDVDSWVKAIQACLSDNAVCQDRVSLRRAVAAQHDWRLLAARTANIMASELGQDVKQKILDAQLSPAEC